MNDNFELFVFGFVFRIVVFILVLGLFVGLGLFENISDLVVNLMSLEEVIVG